MGYRLQRPACIEQVRSLCKGTHHCAVRRLRRCVPTLSKRRSRHGNDQHDKKTPSAVTDDPTSEMTGGACRLGDNGEVHPPCRVDAAGKPGRTRRHRGVDPPFTKMNRHLLHHERLCRIDLRPGMVATEVIAVGGAVRLCPIGGDRRSATARCAMGCRRAAELSGACLGSLVYQVPTPAVSSALRSLTSAPICIVSRATDSGLFGDRMDRRVADQWKARPTRLPLNSSPQGPPPTDASFETGWPAKSSM